MTKKERGRNTPLPWAEAQVRAARLASGGHQGGPQAKPGSRNSARRWTKAVKRGALLPLVAALAAWWRA